MDHYNAKKVVIITEKLIADKVAKLIEACGAKGYTVTAAGGKGSRGVRSDRGGASDAFVNVKFEIIVASADMANEITDTVAETLFDNYSGITYLEDVEILRPQKF